MTDEQYNALKWSKVTDINSFIGCKIVKIEFVDAPINDGISFDLERPDGSSVAFNITLNDESYDNIYLNALYLSKVNKVRKINDYTKLLKCINKENATENAEPFILEIGEGEK